MDRKSLLDIAVDAARRAGDVLLEYFGRDLEGLGTKTSSTDLVSDADRASEDLIYQLIEGHRPDDGIVGEEGAGKPSNSGLSWIVDPLDGTVNFVFGIPQWGVSVAVQDDSGSVAGVVHDPNHRETFTGIRGEGAWLNGVRCKVSDTTDLSRALIATGFAYDRRARAEQGQVVGRVLERAADIRRAGAAALDLAWLACGRLDGFYEAHLNLWDRAAGELLIAEAGGVVTELPPIEGLAPGVVAANPGLHDQLRRLVTTEV